MLIPLLDTWFGVSVQPVVITQFSNSSAPVESYGRVLSKRLCPDGAAPIDNIHSTILGCNVEWEGYFPVMSEADESSRLLSGISSTHKILKTRSQSSENLFYLADFRNWHEARLQGHDACCFKSMYANDHKMHEHI